MSLEVHIYGPGYGETILLRWPKAGGGWHGAIVDAHAPGDKGIWLVEKLKNLKLTALEFVVATHPHLDHIHNFAAGLKRSGVSVEHGFFWPPFLDTSWIRFFNQLAAQEEDGELSGTAAMMEQWFDYCADSPKNLRGIEGRDDFRPIYTSEIQGKKFTVKAIGPWDAIHCRLAKNVAGSKQRSGRIDYEHRHANDVSIALLIEYGDARIVLGGDMEEINWGALKRASARPEFRPSLVKVSHHGSKNGRMEGMWSRGGGFFEGRSARPIAVVTPWRPPWLKPDQGLPFPKSDTFSGI